MIRVTGAALLKALENSVSAYPALEGRFPQVSNITMEFDPSLPPHRRIKWANVGDSPIDLERKYVLVTRGYMGRGKDGFNSLLVESEGGAAEELVSEENGILISMMLRQYFMSLKIIGKWKHWGKSLSRHWNAIHDDLHETHPVVEPTPTPKPTPGPHAKANPLDCSDLHDNHSTTRQHSLNANANGTTTPLDDSEDEGDHRVQAHEDRLSEREALIARKVTRKWRRLAGVNHEAGCVDAMCEGEFQVDWTRVSSHCITRTARFRPDQPCYERTAQQCGPLFLLLLSVGLNH